MKSCNIKNVVFDIGNVIVRWSPIEIVRLTFGAIEEPKQLAESVFQSQIWSDLNKGLISEAEAKAKYQQEHGMTLDDCESLFYYVKHTQLLLHGSVELLTRVKNAGYSVYALTDNVAEIVKYYKSTYEFWPLFDGTTVSAEVGVLKPQPEIYQLLLSKNNIVASETVFIDDIQYNVKGAQFVGMSAIQFENAKQCERVLKSLGLVF